ncbi:MAG: hypothetical protein O3A63_09405 [Proteobacteria bacterium]|nr:hypothetical protein [Pseudomonadota bacterium]
MHASFSSISKFIAVVATVFMVACTDPDQCSDRPALRPTTSLPLLQTGHPPVRATYETVLAAFNQHTIPGLKVSGVNQGIDTSMLLIELDNRRFEPSIVTADRVNTGLSPVDAMRSGSYGVLIGSSFVSAGNPLIPVGLLRKRDQVLSELQIHGYTRILGLTPHGLGVIGHRVYERDLFASALQLGPGIVEQGELDISERDLTRPRYFRSFVALCADRTILGATIVPMHLRTVGAQFLRFADASHLQCDEVVNLAGDRETIIAVSSDAGVTFLGHSDHARVAMLKFTNTP